MTNKMPRIKRRLDDSAISAMLDFETYGMVWDREIRGLRVRVGPRGAVFQYFAEHALHGNRSATFKTLGKFPLMSVKAARLDAMIEAGRVAARDIRPGKRAAVKLGAALDDYLKYLRAKSARKNKPARHADNVEKLRRLHLADFEKWPLADLSNNPTVIKQWHERVTRDAGPITANRVAEVLRACYRYARKLNRNLPPDLPTSGVQFNSETPSQRALAAKDFPQWTAAWREIASPTRRAYHLFCLLTGCRPGEAARIKWSDVRPRSRSIVISGSKSGADIAVPMSVEIARTLRMARNAEKIEPQGRPPMRLIEGQGTDAKGAFIFSGCAQAGHRDGLPMRGNALRHTYRTIAADLGIDEMVAHFLMGHAPAGISQRYVARMILTSGPAMRDAQRKISARIFELLKIEPGDF